MPLTQYLAQRGFVGVAVEVTKGTPVAATSYVQLLDESLAHEPGIVLEKLLRQSRDSAFTPVFGEQKIGGQLSTPLFVDQGLALFTAAIGADYAQAASAAGPGVALGAFGVANAGANSVTITNQPAAPITAGDFVQLSQTNSTTPGPANFMEVHKVGAVSGGGPFTLTLAAGETLVNDYLPPGATVYRVPAGTASFTHYLQGDIPDAGTYKTLTIEKNLGGLASLQYAGALVGKASLQITSKEAAKITYDIQALAEAELIGSTPTYGTSAPLGVANASLALFAAADLSVVAFALDVDQGGQPFWTFAQTNLPTLVTPTARKVTGKWTNIVQNMSYYLAMANGQVGNATLTLAQGTSSIVITLPKLIITKLTAPLKAGSLLVFDAEFQALYDDATQRSIVAQVTNGQWLPFI